MNAWESVREAIDGGDPSQVADRVLLLDEAGRRQVARELPGHIGIAAKAAEERYDRAQAKAARAEERAREEFVRAEAAQGRSREDARNLWWMRSLEGHTFWDHGVDRHCWIEPMRVAGAGTLGGAAAVTTWLYRRDFARWGPVGDLGPLLRAITSRPSPWQADLAVRLALRLRGTRTQAGDDSAELALELLRRTGITPPDHEPLVVAWVSRPPRLEHDPLAEHLVPRLFEAEGVGRALRGDRLDPLPGALVQHSWLRSLRDLVSAGRVSRELLLDGCVRRFLRGGSATDLRFFTRLHDLLSPLDPHNPHNPQNMQDPPGPVDPLSPLSPLDPVSPVSPVGSPEPSPDQGRTRDYLRLLPAAPGPVAELALRELRRAGGLSGEEVNEALAALLFRPEGKLVRAGLSWLDQAARDAARDAAGDLDGLAPALASAFLCESYEVQERAVRLAVKHAGRFSPIGAEAVREAAGVLPADLAEQLSVPYGGVESAPPEIDRFRPVPLPRFDAPAPEPFPEAFTLLAGTYAQIHDGIAFERWLDGFVRAPQAGELPPDSGRLYEQREWCRLEQWTEALLREAADPGHEPPIPEPERAPAHAHHVLSVRTEEGDFEVDFGHLPVDVRESIAAGLGAQGIPLGNLAHHEEGPLVEGEILGISIGSTGYWRGLEEEPQPPRDRLPDQRAVSPPHWAMLLRCAEIHAALKAGTLPPYLLATPTLTSGVLDPAELVARLEGYERAGVPALPADLQQALLRLPRRVDPGVTDRARRLTSEAGATLVRWLEQRPEPAMRVDWAHANGTYTHDHQPGEHSPRLIPRIRLEPTGLALVDALLSDPPAHHWDGHGRHMSSWALTLPSDREATAMHLLPHLLNAWNRDGYFHQYVADLLHREGPVGEGLAVLLAVLPVERGWFRSVERGQELLLRAAAVGCLPAVECGRQLGLALRRDVAKMGDVRSTLDECARQGAHREVWQIMTGLLPAYLPGPGERAHSSHTLALGFAVDAARWAGARGAIPAVAAAAARKGSSGFVRTARRLHEQLDQV